MKKKINQLTKQVNTLKKALEAMKILHVVEAGHLFAEDQRQDARQNIEGISRVQTLLIAEIKYIETLISELRQIELRPNR